jgi:hypothetical protein
MHPTENDIVLLQQEWWKHRDDLRIAGYDLIQYSKEYAKRKAATYRHPSADYEFAIHKIEFTDVKTGQIFVLNNPFYSSRERIEDWTKHFTDKEKPMGAGILKRWFTDPASLVLTAIVPPFALTILGMSAVSDHLHAKRQIERQEILSRLSPIPKFWKGYTK